MWVCGHKIEAWGLRHDENPQKEGPNSNAPNEDAPNNQHATHSNMPNDAIHGNTPNDDTTYSNAPNEDVTAPYEGPGTTHPPWRSTPMNADAKTPATPPVDTQMMGGSMQTAPQMSWSTWPQYPTPAAAGVGYYKILDQNLSPAHHESVNMLQMKTMNNHMNGAVDDTPSRDQSPGPQQGWMSHTPTVAATTMQEEQ
ncbi:hypothetical protein BS47DRAFT_1356932 [Hydnum rufescens UP504]|uniref:Uncharacterized protein n=1 Tax=Hydnum rufescens UP504 TaxID=1448309 RepID=A0A9P6E2R6_9AGAM|nr:hypothetical protein BS47DRAFT_1356932 [Hydnum rufescens UP504]